MGSHEDGVAGPGYQALRDSGALRDRARVAVQALGHCELCPHRCGVNRLEGERGFCRIGRWAVVASAGPHFGEEGPLVGRGGSGTIFFSGCNLSCRYCQNYEISQLDQGDEIDAGGLARVMLALQERGCENVNFVSPSHVVPQVLEGLVLAADAGLRLPLVYNTGGYDSVSTLRLLDGVVDIYMPDVKYAEEATARRLSQVAHYPARNRAAVREMHRQVGDLVLDARGVARRGLLARHLVLPGDLGGTAEVMRFLANDVSPDTYVNVMGQYRPCYESARTDAEPLLRRRPTRAELRAARRAAVEAGLTRLDPG